MICAALHTTMLAHTYSTHQITANFDVRDAMCVCSFWQLSARASMTSRAKVKIMDTANLRGVWICAGLVVTRGSSCFSFAFECNEIYCMYLLET